MSGSHDIGWQEGVKRLRLRLALLEAVQEATDDERDALIASIEDPQLRSEILAALSQGHDGLPVLARIGQPPDEPPEVTTGGLDDEDDDDRRANSMPSPLSPGDRVGRYTILADGAGGQASVVHKATDEATGGTVAFKLLRPGASAHDRGQFERQRLILEAIDHPRIPTAIDHGVVQAGPARGMPFVVMPWIEGIHFNRWARGRPWKDVVRALADVLDTLEAAHAAKIIHRDLTPRNILVRDGRTDGEGPEVWIIDFGISRLIGGPLADLAHATRTSTGAGTAVYMAPEQFGGDGIIGRHTDLYAIGCVLYAALTRCRPHVVSGGSNTAYDIARRREEGPPPMPRGLDAQIVAILRLLLSAAPEDRGYASAADLARDLRRAADGLPIMARPPSVMQRARLWARRNPALATLAAALAVVLTVAIIVGAVQGDRIVQARDEAERARVQAEFARDEARAAEAAAEGRYEVLQDFTRFVIEDHDQALRGDPALIDARRDLAERAALALAAIDGEGPATLEQALHQAEMWLLLGEIGMSIHGRSLWSASETNRAHRRALELVGRGSVRKWGALHPGLSVLPNTNQSLRSSRLCTGECPSRPTF